MYGCQWYDSGESWLKRRKSSEGTITTASNLKNTFVLEFMKKKEMRMLLMMMIFVVGVVVVIMVTAADVGEQDDDDDPTNVRK